MRGRARAAHSEFLIYLYIRNDTPCASVLADCAPVLPCSRVVLLCSCVPVLSCIRALATHAPTRHARTLIIDTYLYTPPTPQRSVLVCADALVSPWSCAHVLVCSCASQIRLSCNHRPRTSCRKDRTGSEILKKLVGSSCDGPRIPSLCPKELDEDDLNDRHRVKFVFAPTILHT